jgi:beta-phosphoglucomutase-like phosphatase (HAD superfamily)
MLKAIIFDFDGIIAHTEPIHLKAFQATLGDYDMEMTEGEYFDKYLAYDDKTFFRELFKDRGIESGELTIDEMMSVKSAHFDNLIIGNIQLLPGVRELIKSVGHKYPLAIGSGALGVEIRQILEHARLEGYFKVIVSADEVERSKPAPDVFIEALSRMNQAFVDSGIIYAENCLVIEDSVSGIEAALSSGMKCLAITNSYPADKLSQAHLVKDSLEGLGLDELEALF